MRSFEIQEDWTLDKAQEMGESAAQAWRNENNEPMLDTPRESTQEEKKALIEMCERIPHIGTSSEPSLWGEIASDGGNLIARAKSLSQAAHLFVAFWRKHRTDTKLTPAGMEVSGITQALRSLNMGYN